MLQFEQSNARNLLTPGDPEASSISMITIYLQLSDQKANPLETSLLFTYFT